MTESLIWPGGSSGKTEPSATAGCPEPVPLAPSGVICPAPVGYQHDGSFVPACHDSDEADLPSLPRPLFLL